MLSFTKEKFSGKDRVRGYLVPAVWGHDPTLYAPPRYRRACKYDAFVPDMVGGANPSVSAELAGLVGEAEARILELNDLAQHSRVFDPLVRLLLRTESIASSKIEGLQVDVRGLARAEAAQETGRPIGRESAEVLGNIDAMAFAVEQVAAAPRLSVIDICEIHDVLMRSSPTPSIGGRLRERQNWIGGNDYNPCNADFVPPPPEHVQTLLDDLCTFLAEDSLSPLVHAAIAHAQFETIHPFADGNGRTGRALIHVVLRRRGLAARFVPPISVVLAARRDRYIQGLTAFREDRVSEWLELFASAAGAAVTVARRYADAILPLQERWREAVRSRRQVRGDSAIWAVIDVLPAHPVLTVPVAVAATRRTKPAVNNAVAELVEAGVLVPLGQSKRNRAWEAAGLLDLIAELEASTARAT